MKRLFFEWIWQWVNSEWIGFNPIGMEFEYDKSEPSVSFRFVLLGAGFALYWLVPWETRQSKYYKECTKNLTDFFHIYKDSDGTKSSN
jgi:hypothetical protein